jgi:hypothetical protein
MNLSLRNWISKGLGFSLLLSAISAPAFASVGPEIDPGLWTGAMALLGSGMMLIAARRRPSK